MHVIRLQGTQSLEATEIILSQLITMLKAFLRLQIGHDLIDLSLVFIHRGPGSSASKGPNVQKYYFSATALRI